MTLTEAGIAALIARAKRDVDDGKLPSCQIGVARHGELEVFETFGAPPTSRYLTFSVTKAFNAALAWVAMGDGLLSDTTRVADVIPEFATNGKDAVTVEHLLTHTAGFARAPMRPEEGADPAARIERMATWRLDWEPGTRTEYHATSAYWALATVVERLLGGDHRDLFAARVAGPLGIPGLTLGAPPEAQDDVRRLEVVDTSDAAGSGGPGLGDHVAETSENLLLRYNEPDVLAAGVPGAGAVASAADVALFYQALLDPPADVFDPPVIADATTHVRNTLVDELLQCPANRTLGLVVAGDDGYALYRGFGRSAGPRSFGAMGVGGQIAWADPDTGLSFCYLTNGLDADVMGSFQRSAKIAGLAARAVAG